VTLRKHVGRRLTIDQEALLYGGPGILSFVDVASTFGTLAAAREAWAIHGERLTAEYDLKPWGWWQWTATAAEKEQELAFQQRRHTDQRREPGDPMARMIPHTSKAVLPHYDGNGNGRPRGPI
jgi:hypothetical protein